MELIGENSANAKSSTYALVKSFCIVVQSSKNALVNSRIHSLNYPYLKMLSCRQGAGISNAILLSGKDSFGNFGNDLLISFDYFDIIRIFSGYNKPI